MIEIFLLNIVIFFMVWILGIYIFKLDEKINKVIKNLDIKD